MLNHNSHTIKHAYFKSTSLVNVDKHAYAMRITSHQSSALQDTFSLSPFSVIPDFRIQEITNLLSDTIYISPSKTVHKQNLTACRLLYMTSLAQCIVYIIGGEFIYIIACIILSLFIQKMYFIYFHFRGLLHLVYPFILLYIWVLLIFCYYNICILFITNMNICVHIYHQANGFIFLGLISRRRIVGAYSRYLFNFIKKTTKLFFKVTVMIHSPTNKARQISLFHFLINTQYHQCFVVMVLIYISLKLNDVKYVFRCLITHTHTHTHIYYLCVWRLPIFNWVLWYLVRCFYCVLKSFSKIFTANIFSLCSYWCFVKNTNVSFS